MSLLLQKYNGEKNAYCKIIDIYGTKNNMCFNICYLEQNNKNNIMNVAFFTFTPNVADDSANFIKQGYEHLKTLDEFKNAIDC